MILFARDLGFRVTNGGRHGLHVTNGRVSIPIPKHGNGSLGNIAYKIKKQIERAAESISNGVQ
jgi:hypothetical protein